MIHTFLERSHGSSAKFQALTVPLVCANGRIKAGRLVVMVTTVINPVCHSEMATPPLSPATPLLPPETTVHFSSLCELNSWLSDGSNDPMRIRSLRLTRQNVTSSLNWNRKGPEIEKVCTSFPNVESLTLVDPDLISPDNISYSPFTEGFGPKLTSLSIEHAIVNEDSLSRLIKRFPMLEELMMHYISPGPIIPKITSQFKGKLTLSNISEAYECATYWQAMMVAEMRLDNYVFRSEERMKELFEACGRTVKKVEISDVTIFDIRSGGSFHWRSRVLFESHIFMPLRPFSKHRFIPTQSVRRGET